MRRPRVSEDKRHLAFNDGTPFFWLGDTAWELFHRLSLEEADHYLKTRSAQGFNVVQAVGLAEHDGIRKPNFYGHLPLVDEDPTRLNEPYWRHVDAVVERAERYGMVVGLLPTWGDKINLAWGVGPVLFDEPKARAFGRLIGTRYRGHDNVLWIGGGDRDPADRKAVWRALAHGLREGDDSHERLMTYHPGGGRSSGDDFQADDWLDLNMLQTGHGKPDLDYVSRLTRTSYDRTPTKPVLDGEPCYENHPVDFNKTNGYFDEGNVRRATYTSVFSGGCGVTYGCHAVWQFASDRYEPINNPISHWRYSLGLPGANQIHHLKDLMLSLPFLQMRPVPAGTGEASQRRALATPNGDVAAIFLPWGGDVTFILKGARAEWFDPTTGTRHPARAEGETDTYRSPRRDGPANDWVLLLTRP